MKQAISKQLDKFVQSLKEYTSTRDSYPAYVRRPFTFSVKTSKTNDRYFDEIIGNSAEPGSRTFFQIINVLNASVSPSRSVHLLLAEKTLGIFVPFVAMHLSEQSFSKILDVKAKEKEKILL